ncbi:MAG: hypothetical protein KF883_07820 [Thermomicrobiales bacterium]|nr:hypothetical protein [Thermomicrobiales bacterium]
MDLEPALIRQLAATDILRYGHFAFRTGRHSAALIDRDLLLADPATASHFAYNIAKNYFTDRVETVVTPSIWGAGLAQWIGYFLEPKAKVVDATPHDGEITIAEKLLPLIEGKRVLLADNLILSGQTMSRLLDLTKERGATVVGVATLWCAAGDQIGDMPVYAALNGHFPAWAPDDCPGCSTGLGDPEIVPY